MKLNILSDKIAWFGKHSGYEAITDYFPNDLNINIVAKWKNIIGKIIGKIYQIVFKWPKTNPQDTFAELRFLNCANLKSISHILYLEGHIELIDKYDTNKKQKIIGTIHLPISQWSEKRLSLLSKFENAIILYEEELDAFKEYLPLHKIKFIRHGVGIDFFKPNNETPILKNKVLIVGHYLRNFDMLFKVYEKVYKKNSELEFHIIIPAPFRNNYELKEMAKSNSVFFHQNLSDQQLLEQYQDSNLLLIPMNDSGANTAIVQAISVGLPVITTDVGGIRSYGGGEVFPVVKNNDVDGMISLFEKYYSDESFRNEISKKQREFAVTFLDWKLIAQQHLDYYKSIEKKN